MYMSIMYISIIIISFIFLCIYHPYYLLTSYKQHSHNQNNQSRPHVDQVEVLMVLSDRESVKSYMKCQVKLCESR